MKTDNSAESSKLGDRAVDPETRNLPRTLRRRMVTLVRQDNETSLSQLLATGADPDPPSHPSSTHDNPLRFAVELGRTRSIALLIAYNADPKLAFPEDYRDAVDGFSVRESFLRFAERRVVHLIRGPISRPESLGELVQAVEAQIGRDLLDRNQDLALCLAVLGGHVPSVEHLLAHDAQPQRTFRATDSDVGVSALRIAADLHHPAVFEALRRVEDKNSPIIGDDMFRYLPLVRAAEWGQASRVQQLIKAVGSEYDFFDRHDLTIQAALYYAALAGQVQCVKLCLDGGGVASGMWIYDPLVAALRGNSSAVVRVLLDQGARLSKKSLPLVAGAIERDPSLAGAVLSGVRMSESMGVKDWNLPDGLLSAVVASGRTLAVEALLAYHADPNVGSHAGSIGPLELAVMLGFADIASRLLVAGADVTVLESIGGRQITGRALAAEQGWLDLCEVLDAHSSPQK